MNELLEPSEKPQRKSRRRGNGEGSINQRTNGRWEAVISIGYGADGKRKRRTVYGWSKKEVQDKLTKLQSNKLDGTLSEPTKMNVAKFLQHWLENAAKPTIRETSYLNYSSNVNKHICPRIGGILLSKLTPLHVQGMYSDLERSKISVNVQRSCHNVLHRALKQALRWGMVSRNACDAVEVPRAPRVEIKPLDSDQVARLLQAAAGDRMEAIYVLAIGTGMRLGELFGLHWSDVDLDAGTVTIRQALIDVNATLKLAEPKTAKSRRRLDLPDTVVAALLQHRRKMIAEGLAAVPWVFPNKFGGPQYRSNFHRLHFQQMLARAGLPPMRFHNLRHTSATLLLSAGVHPKIVQERLGHSQISMTLDTYSHVLQGMGREAAGKLNTIMTAKPKAVSIAAG